MCYKSPRLGKLAPNPHFFRNFHQVIYDRAYSLYYISHGGIKNAINNWKHVAGGKSGRIWARKEILLQYVTKDKGLPGSCVFSLCKVSPHMYISKLAE